MNDQICLHSCSKETCLQVFLFTKINVLFEETYKIIQQARFQDPIFFILPSPDLKKSLHEFCLEKQGYDAFLEAGLLRETVQKLCLQPIFDDISLVFALTQGIEVQEAAIKELFPFSENLKKGEILQAAKKLAQEILWLDENDPEYLKKHFSELLECIKKYDTSRVFLHEAFMQIDKNQTKLVFVGWPAVPIYYLERLVSSSAKIFSYVPSRIYLGDILSPKARLQFLKNQKRNFLAQEENPLLSLVAQDYKDFYQYLIEKDIDHDFYENEIHEMTELHKLQDFLLEGDSFLKIGSDHTFKMKKAESLYQLAHQIYSHLVSLSSKGERIDAKNVALVTHQPEALSDLLTAVSMSYPQGLYWQSGRSVHPLWLFLQEVIVADLQSICKDQYLEHFIHLRDLYFEPIKKSYCTFLIKALQNSHSSNLNLSDLKNALLRRAVFDFEEKEPAYEISFLDTFDFDDNDDFFLWFDSLIDFYQKIHSAKLQLQTLYDFGQTFQPILNSIVLEGLDVFFIKKQILQFISDHLDQKMTVSLEFFSDTIGSLCTTTSFSFENKIKVYTPYELPPKMFDHVIFAQMSGKKGGLIEQLKQEGSVFNKKDHTLLWINQTTKNLTIFESPYQEADTNSQESGFIKELKKLSTDAESLNFGNLNYIFPGKINHLFDLDKIEKDFEGEISLDAEYIIEIGDLLVFLKDPETWLKKYFGIRKEAFFLDSEIHQRHLFLWKIQQEINKGYDKTQIANADVFKEFENEIWEDSFIRSHRVEKEDHLLNYAVLPTLKVALDTNCEVSMIGLSSQQKEKIILKNLEKIKTYCFLKDQLLKT